jgi:predicted Zn-dependent protease
MLAAGALAACEAPTPPTRAGAFAYRFDIFGDSTKLLSFHWPADRMPLRFWSNPGDSLTSYVAYAIDQWEAQFLYGEFTGVIVADSSQADIIVQTTPSAPTGSLADLPAYELKPGCGGVTQPDSISIDGEMFGPMRAQITWDFLATRTAADSQARVRCLARVVTHEIGHALGILNEDHAGTDSTDIMFTFPRVSVPSDRDRETMQRVYHTPSDMTAPVRPH